MSYCHYNQQNKLFKNNRKLISIFEDGGNYLEFLKNNYDNLLLPYLEDWKYPKNIRKRIASDFYEYYPKVDEDIQNRCTNSYSSDSESNVEKGLIEGLEDSIKMDSLCNFSVEKIDETKNFINDIKKLEVSSAQGYLYKVDYKDIHQPLIIKVPKDIVNEDEIYFEYIAGLKNFNILSQYSQNIMFTYGFFDCDVQKNRTNFKSCDPDNGKPHLILENIKHGIHIREFPQFFTGENNFELIRSVLLQLCLNILVWSETFSQHTDIHDQNFFIIDLGKYVSFKYMIPFKRNSEGKVIKRKKVYFSSRYLVKLIDYGTSMFYNYQTKNFYCSPFRRDFIYLEQYYVPANDIINTIAILHDYIKQYVNKSLYNPEETKRNNIKEINQLLNVFNYLDGLKLQIIKFCKIFDDKYQLLERSDVYFDEFSSECFGILTILKIIELLKPEDFFSNKLEIDNFYIYKRALLQNSHTFPEHYFSSLRYIKRHVKVKKLENNFDFLIRIMDYANQLLDYVKDNYENSIENEKEIIQKLSEVKINLKILNDFINLMDIISSKINNFEIIDKEFISNFYVTYQNYKTFKQTFINLYSNYLESNKSLYFSLSNYHQDPILFVLF